MTPHNEAKIEDISNIVLMPGDPLRAKYIADTFLDNSKLVNTVRNMFGYTGFYKGKKITVFASGMGMPSIGIYSYELYKFYNVDTIIRIGSCGAYNEDLNLLDTILVDNAYTEGNYAYELNEENCHIMNSSTDINKVIEDTAKGLSIPYVKGNTLCTDCFDYYVKDVNSLISRFPKDLNIIGAEMEAFALFYNAKLLGKKASCLLSVVDSHYKHQEISAEERQTSLNSMIKLALESAANLYKYRNYFTFNILKTEPQGSVHFYFVIDKTLYLAIPPGVFTSTISFFFFPSKAAPTGDSLEIFFSAKFTSVDPTIVKVISSSYSSSCTFTIFPTWTVFVSISDSSIILAYLILFSNSAIFPSFSAWAFFASSYSEFSDRSPNPSATFIFSAISALFVVLK